jgi:hypothetical protein
MSADNGYIVKHVENPDEPDGEIAIFYYMGDHLRSESEGKVTWLNTMIGATTALVTAHILNYKEPTEYGVSVTKEVLNIIEPGALDVDD